MLGIKELHSYSCLDKVKKLLACERCSPPSSSRGHRWGADGLKLDRSWLWVGCWVNWSLCTWRIPRKRILMHKCGRIRWPRTGRRVNNQPRHSRDYIESSCNDGDMEESPVKENVLKNSELWQRSHLHHTPKLAQWKFGGKCRKFEMVADML